MVTRTSSNTVVFARPFTVAGELRPAGRYLVEVEEELLEPLNFAAWRAVAALIHREGSTGAASWISVDPAELRAAIGREADAEERGS